MRTRTRLGASAVAAALLTGVTTVLAAPAQAVPVVEIARIYFDSPGSDTGSNASLNAEYVMLRNNTSVNRTITGWTIRDRAGTVYKFPSPTTIGPRGTVVLRTGRGTNAMPNRYWQKTWYVWNNTGDTAYLRTATGALVDSCSYTAGGAYKTC